MLIRNFKSSADEIAKRNLANELLQVEISNASILDDRISAYKNPNKPPPVPPEYKSSSDMQKDVIRLEKEAIDGLMDMKFDYTQASKIVSKIRDMDSLFQLVQGLPFIKSDLTKKFNPRLIDAQFFLNYFENYLSDLSVSFGFTFNKDGIMDVASISELHQVLPTKAEVDSFNNDVGISIMDGEYKREITGALGRLSEALPTTDEENAVNNLDQIRRIPILRKIAGTIKKASIPTPSEIKTLQRRLQNVKGDQYNSDIYGENLMKRLSGLTFKNLTPLRDARNDIVIEAGLAGKLEEVEPVIPSGYEEKEELKIKSGDIIDKDRYRNEIADLLASLPINKQTEFVDSAIENIQIELEKNNLTPDDLGPAYIDFLNAISIPERIRLFPAVMRVVMDLQEQNYIRTSMYNPEKRRYLNKQHNKEKVGFGVKSLKKHFKEDEKLLKKVAKHMEDESSSDEEVKEVLKKHSKAEKPLEAKIEKSIGGSYIHKRIPVKKIVGKGIDVVEQPTYKTFGKYVMHIPFLLDRNVLNLKYPSLGAIPSIKPLTISDDYKEFIIDVMNTGRPNEKAYSQLPTHEQKHFERIVKGAGLIDTFKLKRNGDDEEKKEVDRFNLLRGNYLGGNNSPDVIKELKSLVVRFINDGRIARNEGLTLLMELSI